MDTLPLSEIFSKYTPGDEWTWDAEFGFLESTHQAKLDFLATAIQEQGIKTPILLGPDGRIWDGHHRLWVAKTLGFEEVPVEYAVQAS